MAGTEQEPIAVIGMACRLPGGSNSPTKLWDLLRSPRDLSKRVPADRFSPTGFYHANGSQHGATDATHAYFLDEDVTRFDNTFFNTQPAEAEAMDPQQRLVLETVYDSLCASGQTIENLRGSNTAVHVGQMCDDWSQTINRDWDLMPTYTATGTIRAILSNRVSYFFDWHGPSMTIDTACSSSLVAVHQGVVSLRNGECPIAIAVGANLMLAPGIFIAESNLHMLSPTGTSKMWDAAADGYARGEGIAAVVLKTLSAALRDGDHIDCIIRETGVNQDGKTQGLTMPNNLAQAELIRDTYKRAGLDINDQKDRPQFFQAHGTGTPAGDPKEAEAISQAFFGDGKLTDKLYVGSVKTVIGHTEGSAGLASLIASAMALQHGIVPPNLHFKNISPRVAPYCTNLEIPTSAKQWPSLLPGQPRRASVNSFGFGGTNAHAILEYYEPESSKKAITPTAAVPVFTPLTISAASSSALRATLDNLRTYLKANPGTNIRDLAYTMQTRRSTLAYRKLIIANNIEDAIRSIDGLLADDDSSDNGLTTRYYDVAKPCILGVFTGQGAQWPRMGARLIEESPFAAQRIAELQRALSTLPEADRPDWTLYSQLLAGPKASRLAEAAIAQPLCTAVQIVLVDLLRAANIQLRAVVGHSSGEIAAAYAAGFLSATTAIRVAFYRGLYAKLARSPSGGQGAMMAVGTSFENAQSFCEREEFVRRIQVAARNSSTSITLSGDEDAIEEAVANFTAEGKFARKLKVDTAYHSTHMLTCAKPYLAGLARAGYTVGEGNETTWFSSVVNGGGHIMAKEDVQNPQYWVDNMTSAVLFEPSIAQAVTVAGPFDIAIEFGPHPALKGPALHTIEQLAGRKIPYTGLLARSKNDVDELAAAIGYIWTQLGASSVCFAGFEKLISGASSNPGRLISDLPTYPFDHSRTFGSLTRFSGGHRNLQEPPHPLLGRRLVETEMTDEISWRNVLRPAENSWIQGHALQGQSVFPAMGFVSMAVEAVAAVATGRKLGLITLENVVIGRALAFSDDDAGIETKVTLNIIRSTDDELSTRITCHSGHPFDSATPLALNFSATASVVFHEPQPDTLPSTSHDEINLLDVRPERLYSQFTQLGYNYNRPFTGVRAIQRKMGWATGDIEDESGDSWEDKLLVHPGWLDSAIQTGFAAYSYPYDNRLFALLVPTAIHSIIINPYFFDTSATRQRTLQYQTSALESPEFPMEVDIAVFPGRGADQSHPFVQFESVKVRPFAAATERDDAVLFSRFNYGLAEPDAIAAVEGDELLPTKTSALWSAIDRVGFFYLRRVHEAITPAEAAAALPHFKHLLDYAGRLIATATRGENPAIPREALTDSPAFVRSLIAKYHDSADMQIVEAAGEHLITEVRRNGSMLEHMTKDGLLDTFYAKTAGVLAANALIARIVVQIAHRYPRMHLFEVGAGNGSTTRSILSALHSDFSSYTFTDVEDGSISSAAEDHFTEFPDRMAFATFDVERPVEDQGFEQGAYDIVIVSNVLTTRGKLDVAMANMRRLLRPGGYLIALEIVSECPVGINTIMGGLAQWWAGGAEGSRLTLSQWDALTRQNGFSGIDTRTPVVDKLQWLSVFVTQAVNDRVNSLRAPLASPVSPLGQSNITQLVIVGGHTAAVARLAEEAITILSPRYEAVTHLKSLEELDKYGIAPGSSVLSLTELDEEFLETRTQSKLDALKTLWRNGGSVLWVTRGARNERPFSSITLGLFRIVPFEYPKVNLQLLDFDTATKVTPQIVAEALVRLELSARFQKEEGESNLWTMEREIYYIDGRLHIPRLLPDIEANKRYNSYRRTVQDDVDVRKTTVVLEPAAGGNSFELATVSPLRVLPAPRRMAGKTVTLQVEQSLLQVFNVHGCGYFALLSGEDVESKGERFIALVDTAVESRACIPVEWAVRVPRNISTDTIATTLVFAGAHLLAQSIIAAAPHFGGTVLVHEADELLMDVLDKVAARECVRVVFTTAVAKFKKAVDGRFPYVFVHEKLPVRLVRALLPHDISLMVDLSSESAASADLVARSLPLHTARATAADFLRLQPGLSRNADVVQVGALLKLAWQTVTSQHWSSLSLRKQVPILPLQDVAGSPAVNAKLSVVDWTSSSSVRALVRPIDHGTIFRADGTYLLIGLTGDLGQSLCTWMVARGARHVVLGSRRPKVDPRFVDSLAAQGATIKIVAVDITSRKSLHAAYNTIRAELPPVIGVANGAMLMEDMIFDDLDLATFERTASPKIDGSLLLDEIFYDVPLDFFILFSSLASVIGNGGQSAYVMANEFMAALASQRRNIRGVAGSDIAMSAVLGLGYFEHANHLGDDHFIRLTYRNMSEKDLHELFAEAVLAGRPGTKGMSEVVTGVSPFPDSLETHVQLRTNPRFNHFFLHDNSSNGLQGASGKTERPRARLAAAKSCSEARAIVRETFIARLKYILMIPQGESVNEEVTFVEQGVDSVMAVEVRSWFLQELDVDLPVLKILGTGSTVESLLDDVMDDIPAEILDLEKLESEGGEPAAAPTTALAALAPAPVPTPALSPAPIPVASAPSPPTRPLMETANSSTGTESSSSLSTPQSPLASPLQSPLTTPLETPLETPLDRSMILSYDTEHKRQREESGGKSIIDSATEITQEMTLGQKRFWFLNHYIDDRTSFNIAYKIKLTGRIRINDFAQAVEIAAQRHEALRTRFFWSDDNTKMSMQGILSKTFVRLETATIESEAQADEELEAMRDHVWDLGSWVQLRLRLLSISDTVHYFILGTHHISLDGHSISILLLDINQAYNDPGRPLSPLPDSSQARAFGEQQLLAYRSGNFQAAVDYYRKELQAVDLTRPVELLSFARSQVRLPLKSYDNHVAKIRLNPETAANMKQLARRHRATSFHGYLAALQVLLFRLLPVETTDKLVIGIADANRMESKFMRSLGNFLNVLPLVFNRTHINQTFGQAIEDARNKVYGGLGHSTLPFDLLLDELAVPRHNTYSPVFQIFMDYKLVTKEQAHMNFVGCKMSEQKWHAARSSYDIALEISEDHESVLVIAHVQGGLYSKEAMDLFLRSYVNMLTEVVKHGGDMVSVEKLEKWDKADVKKALELGKGPDLPLEWPSTVAHRIDQIIAQHPDKIAVKDGFGRVLTYAELDQRVESIAHALHGKLPDQSLKQSVVGVFQTPAADWIASLVAIFRVGAIYTPLDLKVSAPRLKGYVKMAQPAAILTDSETVGRTKEIGVMDPAAVINVSDLPATVEGSMERIATAAQPERPAYIIFTSGSTGEPKAVVIKHSSFHALAEGFVRQWDIATLGRVVLQQFPLTSDGSLKQIVAAITTGGCLVVAPAYARGDPTELTRLIAEHYVTFAVATPSEWSMWFRFAPDNLRRCTALTSAWFGGERAPPSLLDSFRNLSNVLPNLRFFNTYGPTEATISTVKGEADVRDANLTVPVPSRILPNYAVYIVDEESQPVPVNVPGEIIIGGAGVGKNEYLNRPDLTATQFPVDPFVPEVKKASGWGRMYRTGDYGRLNAQGLLTIEGRVAGDAQVKVRGFRVELGEIEGVITREVAGALAHAVVTLRDGEGDHDGLLVAHVLIENYKDKTEAQAAEILDRLRTRLSVSLPQYMIPAIIVLVDELPLTAHGKVDRKAVQALPLPEVPAAAQEERKSFTPAELRLADLWATVLPTLSLATQPLTPGSDFFRAGGNSLLLVRLQDAIKRALGDAPHLRDLMNTPELGSMATLLEREGAILDWDEEIALDFDPVPVAEHAFGSNGSHVGLRLLVTGATGSLGKHIMPHLAAHENVAKIIVLARPAEGRDPNNLFPCLQSKVHVLWADLPSLPADNAELSEIDVIVHIAANRNFWDGYGAVKPVNVNTAKELAKLALRTGATLHVLSSGAVADYEADDNDNLPRPDPADGYVSSKWVAERYLSNAARQTGLHITAHRPTKAPAAETAEKPTEAEMALVRNFVLISPILGVRPDSAHIGGTFHVAPIEDVATAMAAAVTASPYEGSEDKALRIVNYPGTVSVRAELMDDLFNQPENETVMKLPTVPMLQWVGRAKRAGLFKWFFTSQELVVLDDERRRIVSRR